VTKRARRVNPKNLPVLFPTSAESQLRGWFAGKDSNSHEVWCKLYELLEGQARSDNTYRAKARDLALFLAYFREHVGSCHVDDWTKPSFSFLTRVSASPNSCRSTGINIRGST